MNKQEKWIEYALLLTDAVSTVFEENGIDVKELYEDNNANEFFHALANVMPARIFNKFTGSDKNFLQFNHIANVLCFEFSNKVESKEGSQS